MKSHVDYLSPGHVVIPLTETDHKEPNTHPSLFIAFFAVSFAAASGLTIVAWWLFALVVLFYVLSVVQPTNHLDFPAVLWLESYLKSYPKSVLIVSHDRTFLNSVITDVVHFTNKKRLESFRGDYTNFLHVKAEKYKNDKRAYEAQKMHRDHLQDFITTFKTEKKTAAQDRKVGQAMSKQKVLDKMVMLENPDEG